MLRRDLYRSKEVNLKVGAGLKRVNLKVDMKWKKVDLKQGEGEAEFNGGCQLEGARLLG
jgi:hypothetical protein